jgi:AcrR family transcriptional regulator
MMAIPRVPQQARSIATRARLVGAAKECLVAQGYAGASTGAVAQAAGVSQGALFKHFASKSQLLGATAAAILEGFVEDFRRAVAAAGEGGAGAVSGVRAARGGGAGASIEARLGPALRVLWGIFRGPEMRALFEIYVVARTDAALEVELGPLLVAHRQSILGEARALLPEVAAHPEFEGVIDAVVYAMQGAVLGLFGADETTDERQLAFFERLARRELEHLLSGVR